MSSKGVNLQVMLNPDIVNAVGGGDLRRDLDLRVLFDEISADEIRYNPEYWPGLYIRFTGQSPAVMIFRTGKYNIAGADSVDELIDANQTFLSVVRKLGLEFEDPEFEVRNLVFLERYEQELNLEPIAIKLGLGNTEYKPEQFPGLVYRSPNFTGTFFHLQNWQNTSHRLK